MPDMGTDGGTDGGEDETPQARSYGPQLSRDAWIYNQHKDGLHTLDAIIRTLEMDYGQEWDLIGSHQGIRNASNRYADFHNLPRINRKAKQLATTC